MSAEIIQFGKLQPSRRSKPPTELKMQEAGDSVEDRIEKETIAVRCTLDGKLYEVCFRGGDVWQISAVNHRIQNGRLVELRRRHWHAVYVCRHELDLQVVAAAKKMRTQNNLGTAPRVKEASLAQLWKRHAQLLRDAEKVKATISLMEREVS